MPALFKFPVPIGVTKATAKQQMLKQLVCTNAPEEALRYHGYKLIAGVSMRLGVGRCLAPSWPRR